MLTLLPVMEKGNDGFVEYLEHGKKEASFWLFLYKMVIILLIAITALLIIDRLSSKRTNWSELQTPEEVLAAFIDVESISGNEENMGLSVEAWLRTNGWETMRQQVTQNTFNVFAHRGNSNPPLILNSHLDTVPPFIPFSEDEDNIYGRGACDAKGQIVALVFAAQEMMAEGSLNPNDIGLLFTTQEETTSLGMITANQLGITPKYILTGEPTDRVLALGHKGSVSLVIESFGKAAHSGYPELGKSAIVPLVKAIERLESKVWPYDPYFGQCTLNTGLISGGVASNVVPEYARANIMIRNVIPFEELQKQIDEVIGTEDGLNVTYVSRDNPFLCSTVPGFPYGIMSFGTDLPSFVGNHQSYLYGPGSILVAHTADEYISKQELYTTIEDYKILVTRILAQGEIFVL
jgi:acetylornithine deacetylase